MGLPPPLPPNFLIPLASRPPLPFMYINCSHYLAAPPPPPACTLNPPPPALLTIFRHHLQTKHLRTGFRNVACGPTSLSLSHLPFSLTIFSCLGVEQTDRRTDRRHTFHQPLTTAAPTHTISVSPFTSTMFSFCTMQPKKP